jgi:hypothetical protein
MKKTRDQKSRVRLPLKKVCHLYFIYSLQSQKHAVICHQDENLQVFQGTFDKSINNKKSGGIFPD